MGNGEGSAKYLAETFTQSGYKPTDFRVYAGCGSPSDMAYGNLTPQIDAMKKHTEIFKYCDNFKDGNLYQAFSEKSGHDNTTIMNMINYYLDPNAFFASGGVAEKAVSKAVRAAMMAWMMA